MDDARRPLTDVYWDVMMDDPVELPDFMARVGAGEFGAYTPAEVTTFLRGVEQDILGSIATKAGAAGVSAALAEERAEETRELIEALIRKYASPGGA